MRSAILMMGVATTVWVVLASSAEAGAWTQPKGKGQVILKAEGMTAGDAFTPAGELVPLGRERRDRSIGVFA